ncbi:hypothetical protein QMO56_07070 [Roseomonas sp. E05]|uniref:hypothetical protein n=1 Tax=Roseomonas sp. E05 TaxID=3046310 RepID=UPI0024BADA1F|nr:hypothetical protein [Roseomonas sp. E05]MDJ0387870.1 hypothetical protein [Roseomonas sp. E05]
MSYTDWGFRSAPFQTSPLPPSEQGARLLVGRDAALRSLMGKIETSGKMPTIEGLNGVGKTSVVNVASYKLFNRHVTTGEGALFIPCRKVFQLDPNRDLQEFILAVLMEVAQTLIQAAEPIMVHGHWLQTKELDRWLNKPQLVSFQGGAWVVQAGIQQETNTGTGFEKSGLKKAVIAWLEQIFPDPEAGGVVCTIDNLELLQSSETARTKLEQLRDELFNIPGLRWVLCGSLGIIFGVVSSPRLDGYLHKPIEISEIGGEHVGDLLQSRILGYARHGETPYLPLTTRSFENLYQVLHGNLRSVLNQADEYCQWMFDRIAPTTDVDKEETFDMWLSNQAAEVFEAARAQLRPKPLEVFQTACEKVLFSPGDFADFGFSSVQAIRPHIRDLESVNLLVSTQDEGDKRRKTIQVTGQGWLVKHHLDQKKQSF